MGLNVFFMSRKSGFCYELTGLALFAAAWVLVSYFIFSRPQFSHFQGFLPGPTFKALISAFTDERFWLSVFTSLRRIVVGISLAAFLGIPASVPHMLTSLRLALGVAWIVLVPAEFLGVSSGLGYLINDARDTMEYDKLMAMIIAIGILGFTLPTFFKTDLFSAVLSWVIIMFFLLTIEIPFDSAYQGCL
jgi:ABC-type nitrate/sulfonate/bicarbonate transport system permease component